jgi:hypothetical protein
VLELGKVGETVIAVQSAETALPVAARQMLSLKQVGHRIHSVDIRRMSRCRWIQAALPVAERQPLLVTSTTACESTSS